MATTPRAWDRETYPLWHGTIPTSAILDRSGPEDMWVRGEGSWLIDGSGRRALDARAGVGNMMLGYGRADVVDAMSRQARELPYVCMVRWELPAPVVVELARALTEIAPSGLDRVRFCHTGGAAVESAILMARSFHRNEGRPDKRLVVGLRDSYHGSPMAAMAASGQRIMHWLFGPMPDGFRHLPEPGSADDCGVQLAAQLDAMGPERIAAVILEPVKGRNGLPLPDQYLRAAREYCTKNDILLVFDEAFTGFGRMGEMFAADISGVSPDIMCLAKGITAGYAALGAVLATDRIHRAFDTGSTVFAHASTTDGHPVACAAALAAIRAYTSEDLVANGRALGRFLCARLNELLDGAPAFGGVRAVGAYVAIDVVDQDGSPLSMPDRQYLEAACRRQGVLVHYTPDTVVLMPPLTMTLEEAEFAARGFASVVSGLRPAVAR
ncbi:aminotransferase family protein [Streptomyces rishiriensis]|uniref:Adenosylmethionine-8-amino-7-oxononanoate aminotransferase n=1 Tax=Streptomyces rishiriensis TaxID=68264 RepID=A0ABU0P1U6_STRRH|nr:aminotransferase class III-fold pyridoxal phosphate-dependent enzyme [Streptomyces rishiriensis]MDQ0585314.1 adenosylmethionine-8-amino-7-oxononanoate aminotransferase [Streptomyces rishiriensis]